ncbi:hypothetical protein Tco_1174165 [Tanacetum coccineum]
MEPPLLEGHTFGSGEGRMEHTFELTDNVPSTPHDSPLPGGYTPGSDEGRMTLDELITLCTKLSKHVLDLEKEKDAQLQVETSSDDDLDEEDASKQGRRSDKLKPITVEPRTPPTTTVFDDEDVTMVMAQTLIKMKEHEAKEKGVSITDVEDSSRIMRGQGDFQVQADAELAQRLHEEELAELERAQPERQRIDADHELAVRLTHEEQEKYTIEERERLFAEFFDQRKKQLAAARAKAIRNKPPTKTQVKNIMITYLKHMGKYTHQQLKNKTYKEIQILYEKDKRWIDDFQPMDTKAIKDSEKKVDSSSKPAGGNRKKTLGRKRAGEKKSKKSAKKQKLEDIVEEQESAKSDEEEATDYEHEKEELRMWLTVVSDEEETVDPNILSAKYPILDWESQNLGNVDMEDLQVYKIIRADGNTSYHKSLSNMLRKFDRQDLVDLHRLVMKRFEDTTPEGYN